MLGKTHINIKVEGKLSDFSYCSNSLKLLILLYIKFTKIDFYTRFLELIIKLQICVFFYVHASKYVGAKFMARWYQNAGRLKLKAKANFSFDMQKK